MIEKSDRAGLADAANRAPSVHNIQPARFRFDDERTITLLEDANRRLWIGDPEGKDNQKSLGAALEGLLLALSERALTGQVALCAGGGELKEVARITIAKGGAPDPFARFAATRATWRGVFAPRNEWDRAPLARLAESCPDLTIIEGPDAIAEIARLFDQASLDVLRAPAYRAELVSWMRLSRRHANYDRDGLNGEHLALSPLEAAGAGVVLGARAFAVLDAVGLAGPLIAEGARVRGASAVALFHRPLAEEELETGRRFYRVWLEIEREGLALCPMSVLADVPNTAQRLLREAGLGPQRKLVTAFRIGRRPQGAFRPRRVRLPAHELIAGRAGDSSAEQ